MKRKGGDDKQWIMKGYTFPCYLAFVELGLSVCRAFDKRSRSVGEKIFCTFGAVLAFAILIAASDLEKRLYLSLILAAILALNWLIAAILYKNKPNVMGTFKQKTFWLCVAILAIVVAVVTVIPTVFLAANPLREEPIEAYYSIGVRESGSDYEGVYIDIGAEEQHAWDVISHEPTITVKWINETSTDVVCDLKCYVYKQTADGWGLCTMDSIRFPTETYTVPAGGTRVQIYSLQGYDIRESGLYRFVAFLDGKAVWFDFEIEISPALADRIDEIT